MNNIGNSSKLYKVNFILINNMKIKVIIILNKLEIKLINLLFNKLFNVLM